MSDLERIGEGELNYKFEWRIRDFFSYFGKDTWCQSPDFQISNTTWFIRMDPNNRDTDNPTGYISLFLYRDLSQASTARNFSLGIKTVDNAIVNVMKSTFGKNVKPEGGWGWPKFIRRSQIVDKLIKLVPLDTLTIVCLIEVKDSATDLIAAQTKLAGDFKKLLISEDNTDVTLNVKKKTFLAHKAVLAARSPVFSAMFKNEMEEKKTGVVRISDCDVEAFGMFLMFLYSGEFDFTKCNICQLYKISDKYDIPELKITCVKLMIENLSVENFGETLIFSDQYHEEKLMNEVQSFFNEHFKEIVSSDSWKVLFKKNFLLANNLLKGIAPEVNIAKRIKKE